MAVLRTPEFAAKSVHIFEINTVMAALALHKQMKLGRLNIMQR
jgi:hypothetical protein